MLIIESFGILWDSTCNRDSAYNRVLRVLTYFKKYVQNFCFQPNITTNVTRVALSDSMFSNNMSMAQQGIVSPESELIDAFLAGN